MQFKSNKKATVFNEFKAVRRYILMYHCFDNASRTGALAVKGIWVPYTGIDCIMLLF